MFNWQRWNILIFFTISRVTCYSTFPYAIAYFLSLISASYTQHDFPHPNQDFLGIQQIGLCSIRCFKGDYLYMI